LYKYIFVKACTRFLHIPRFLHTPRFNKLKIKSFSLFISQESKLEKGIRDILIKRSCSLFKVNKYRDLFFESKVRKKAKEKEDIINFSFLNKNLRGNFF